MILSRQSSYGNLNFIDKFDNYVGWDANSNCCERHGWFISTTLLGPDVDPSVLDEFYWDTATPVYSLDSSGTDWEIQEGGGVVAFRMINDAGDELFLHLYNDHNGYYSHGWEAPYLNTFGGL